MAIYITGDTHGQNDYHKLNRKNLPNDIAAGDTIIVAGDWGVIWTGGQKDNHLINWYKDKPYNFFIVLGNHENYDAIEQLPIVEKYGNPVREVAANIHLTERGYVYTIEDKTFFCFGGATSIDKEFRKEFVTWWSQELPTHAEMERGLDNAVASDYVDFVVTHEIPQYTKNILKNYMQLWDKGKADPMCEYLGEIQYLLDYGHWYSGHYHLDLNVTKKDTILYNKVEKIN